VVRGHGISKMIEVVIGYGLLSGISSTKVVVILLRGKTFALVLGHGTFSMKVVVIIIDFVTDLFVPSCIATSGSRRGNVGAFSTTGACGP